MKKYLPLAFTAFLLIHVSLHWDRNFWHYETLFTFGICSHFHPSLHKDRHLWPYEQVFNFGIYSHFTHKSSSGQKFLTRWKMFLPLAFTVILLTISHKDRHFWPDEQVFIFAIYSNFSQVFIMTKISDLRNKCTCISLACTVIFLTCLLKVRNIWPDEEVLFFFLHV